MAERVPSKNRTTRHALWLHRTCGPSQQAFSQKPKVLSVSLGVGRAWSGLGVDASDDRFGVVFVEPRVLRTVQRMLQALSDACQRLPVTQQGAAGHGVKLQVKFAPMLAQSTALLRTQDAELVVVVFVERGLSVSDQKELSHGLTRGKTERLPAFQCLHQRVFDFGVSLMQFGRFLGIADVNLAVR